MKKISAALLATVMGLAAPAAVAQSKPPLKLGGILDMSSLYADITGAGSETAAKMAVEDFGGEVLGRKVKIVVYNGPGSIRLTNEACGPYTIHYVFDTFAQANVTSLAAVKQGLDSWYFLTADYAFGQDLEKDTTSVVLKAGGKVLGGVRHPLNTSDFSSYLLQAQSSKAKV